MGQFLGSASTVGGSNKNNDNIFIAGTQWTTKLHMEVYLSFYQNYKTYIYFNKIW